MTAPSRPVTPPATADWTALGTAARLAVTDHGVLDRARSMLEDELAAVDTACSRFRDDSELRALDRAGGRPVRVGPLLADAIGVALRAARLTGGAVDPTVGGAMAALGYDRDYAELPGRGAPVQLVARPVPGWRTVHLDRNTVTVPAGTRLDLGATAKAFAADRAAATLHDGLGCGVLVGLGGDIAVAGQGPPGGWSIRVQDTPDGTAGPVTTVRIASGGLATSSTACRRWVRGDTVLHHLVDPLTGLPAPPVWRTVTVHARTCVDANTASTAAAVLGARGREWLAGQGLPARLVGADGHVETLCGWPGEPA